MKRFLAKAFQWVVAILAVCCGDLWARCCDGICPCVSNTLMHIGACFFGATMLGAALYGVTGAAIGGVVGATVGTVIAFKYR